MSEFSEKPLTKVQAMVKFRLPSNPFRKGGNQADGSFDTSDDSNRAIRLSVSLLTFSNFDNCANLLSSIHEWFYDLSRNQNYIVTFVIRNNNPSLDSSEFDKLIYRLRAEFPSISILFFNDGMNIGFGRGHNRNFLAEESDLFLVLNDDIGFGNSEWLHTMLRTINSNNNIGAVGAIENPIAVTPFYGNGVFPDAATRWNMRYAEGSVLLLRSVAFSDIGMFDDDYSWAVFEDADLSFKLQQSGYIVTWTPVPHEHMRSSSFNILPPQTKYSILEQNRSNLFSKWNVSLRSNSLEGNLELYDLWSDGIGDVFCALIHLYCYASELSSKRRDNIVVNTSAPELAAFILGQGIRVTSYKNEHELLQKYDGRLAKHVSLRKVNYALPFNIHTLVASALGIKRSKPSSVDNLKAHFMKHLSTSGLNLPEPYVVLHLESVRFGHDGRIPSKSVMKSMLKAALKIGPHVVLIGKEALINAELMGFETDKIIDLQGKTSIIDAVAICANSSNFVGIDSFPSHAAQIFGVGSAIFFGSVLPQLRCFSRRNVWPITASVMCLGCYHAEIEPAVPFCMRRDIACASELSFEQISATCADMSARHDFDWTTLDGRLEEMLHKYLIRSTFHPSMRNAFVSNELPGNHVVSPLIYQIIESIQHVVGSKTAAKEDDELQRMKQELFVRDLRIEEMVKLIGQLRSSRS